MGRFEIWVDFVYRNANRDQCRGLDARGPKQDQLLGLRHACVITALARPSFLCGRRTHFLRVLKRPACHARLMLASCRGFRYTFT